MTNKLLNLVRAADPLAGSSRSALTANPDSVLQGMLERFTVDARPRRGRAIIASSVALAVLAAAGVAIANGIHPFAGISTADHPATSRDGLDPAIEAWITRINASAQQTNAGAPGFQRPQLDAESARLVRELPSGRRFYVLSTTDNSRLCVLTAAPGGSSGESPSGSISCGDPLSQTQPTTISSERRSEAAPQVTFGIARDDVVAVSFTADGREQTVPVENNVWAHEGPSDALSSLTVHYADGTTQTLTR